MRQHWQKFYEWWTLTRGLGALTLLIGVVSLVVNLPVPPFLRDIAPELVGIGVTVLLLDLANERRAIANERRAEQGRKEELILQMGSPSNDFALEAARILRQKGWLTDGSLRGADFRGANLQGAKLRGAQLQAATLREANLTGADLNEANLQAANLAEASLLGAKLGAAILQAASLREANLHRVHFWGANLQGANLEGANLYGADFWKANLQGANLGAAILKTADLNRANLQGANLDGANLYGADLSEADLQGVTFESGKGQVFPRCNENTMLPDGSRWTPGRDWREFTHPEEWAAEQNKEALLLRLRTTYYSVSVKAILSTLKRQGWLFDGALNHLDLRGVNFTGQDLSGAGLNGTMLNGANLQEAHLERANLQKASLRGANLQGTSLGGANLQGADLRNATLPDGTLWTSDRHWREFTHPDEWAAEQAAKKRFTFSKPPGYARGE